MVTEGRLKLRAEQGLLSRRQVMVALKLLRGEEHLYVWEGSRPHFSQMKVPGELMQLATPESSTKQSAAVIRRIEVAVVGEHQQRTRGAEKPSMAGCGAWEMAPCL